MSGQEITVGGATLTVARNGLGYWGTYRPPTLPTTLGPCDTLEELLERARRWVQEQQQTAGPAGGAGEATAPTAQPTQGPRCVVRGDAVYPCCVCGEPSVGRDGDGDLACGRHGAVR